MVRSDSKNLEITSARFPVWRNYALMAMVAFLPFYPKYFTPIILFVFLLWLFEKKDSTVWGKLFDNKPAIFMILFYLWHIVGLIWTSNFKFAGLDLQIKAPFLIFPLILIATNFSTESITSKLFLIFKNSLIVSVAFCLIRAGYLYLFNDLNYFYYKEFSYFLHPGYFSMYLCFGSAIVLNELFDSKSNPSIVESSTLQLVYLIVFTFTIVLLESKAGILIQLLLLLAGSILFIGRARSSSKKFIYGMPILFVGLLYFGFFSSITSGRMDELKSAVSKDSNGQVHSSVMRLQAWESAISLIKQNPILGTGTGDVKTDLVNIYFKKGYFEIYKLQLNSHNQYLQSFAALGIVGFILLCLIVGYSLFYGFRSGNYLLVGFLVIIGLNMLVESVAEVTAGSVFISLFYALLILNKKNISSNGNN